MFTPIAGTYCDVARHPSGFAFVYVKATDPLTIVATINGPTGTVQWEHTHTGPLLFVRCAVDPSGNIAAIASVGSNSGPDGVVFIDASGIADLGGSVTGTQPVMITYESGWVAYICRTATRYVRWPLSGSEPATQPNPFPGGTQLGILDVVGSTITWGQMEGTTASRTSVVINNIRFISPMTRGGITVGQSEGFPLAAEAVLAGQAGSFVSTVIPTLGFEPHIAQKAGGGYVICCRTLNSGGNSAAINVAPPWPAFEGDGLALSQSLRAALYLPASEPIENQQTGLFRDPWLKFLRTAQRVLLNAFDLTTGAVDPGKGGTGVTTGLTVLNASALTTGTVPQAAKWSEVTTTLTGTQDDFDFEDADLLRGAGATDLTLAGLSAGVGGQRLLILAIGAGDVILADQEGTSDPENRIITGTGSDLTLTSGQFAFLSYDGASERWRVMQTASGSATPPFELLTADPGAPDDDTWWVVRDGTSPTMTLAVKCRVGGVTYTIASITA